MGANLYKHPPVSVAPRQIVGRSVAHGARRDLKKLVDDRLRQRIGLNGWLRPTGLAGSRSQFKKEYFWETLSRGGR
jgi:hypothetical protein